MSDLQKAVENLVDEMQRANRDDHIAVVKHAADLSNSFETDYSVRESWALIAKYLRAERRRFAP